MSKLSEAISQLSGRTEAEYRQLERNADARAAQAKSTCSDAQTQLVGEMAADLENGGSISAATVAWYCGRLIACDLSVERKLRAARWQRNVAMNARRDAQEARS